MAATTIIKKLLNSSYMRLKTCNAYLVTPANFILPIFFVLLMGCEDKLTEPREYPIIKAVGVSNINELGVTLSGELVRKGTSAIISYGFVWDTNDPKIDSSFSVELGNDFIGNEFKVRIDSNLAKDVKYSARMYARFNNQIVYSNSITFQSLGCSKSGWSLEVPEVRIEGYSSVAPLGCANSEKGYIIFPSAYAFSFNPANNEVNVMPDFPTIGNDKTVMRWGQYNNLVYIITNENGNIYSLESDSWKFFKSADFKKIGISSFFAINDKFYVSKQQNLYDLDNVNKIATIPTEIIFSNNDNLVLNHQVYMLGTDGNVWKFDLNEKLWSVVSQFPGKMHKKVVSFIANSKLYFGLGHYGPTPANWMDRRLWEFDPETNVWNVHTEFPVQLTSGRLFYFTIKNNLYIGNYIGNDMYSIWKCNLDK